MAIDQESREHLDDLLVHEPADDEDPLPEGLGIYFTPKFLGRVTMVAYALMVVLVLAADAFYTGSTIPVFLKPGSLLVALPFLLVGLYLNFMGSAEDVLIKKRSMVGRLMSCVVGYGVLQALTTGTWIGLSLAFSLH